METHVCVSIVRPDVVLSDSQNRLHRVKSRMYYKSVKIKVKVNLKQVTKAQWGNRGNSSTLSLASALDGGLSTPRPGRFTHGKGTRYQLYRKLGVPQGRSGRVRKISPPNGIRSLDQSP